MSSPASPKEARAKLLELHRELWDCDHHAAAIVVGALAPCIFRVNLTGTVSERPPSQIKRALRSQARTIERVFSCQEAPSVREPALLAARRLNEIAENIPNFSRGRQQSVTNSPARYLLNELAPLFAQRLEAAGHSNLAATVLAKGQSGTGNMVGAATPGWQLFEDFILTRSPAVGAAVGKGQLRQARRNYLRSNKQQ